MQAASPRTVGLNPEPCDRIMLYNCFENRGKNLNAAVWQLDVLQCREERVVAPSTHQTHHVALVNWQAA